MKNIAFQGTFEVYKKDTVPLVLRFWAATTRIVGDFKLDDIYSYLDAKKAGEKLPLVSVASKKIAEEVIDAVFLSINQQLKWAKYKWQIRSLEIIQ